MVKNLLTMHGTWVRFLGQEDPLEKGIATHSSILAWRIPFTEEPGGLSFMGHDWAANTSRYIEEFSAILRIEDSRVWVHWNRSFDIHLSYLGPVSCGFSSWVSPDTSLGWLQQLTGLGLGLGREQPPISILSSLGAHCLGGYSEVKWNWLSRAWLVVTPWTIQSMKFSRPEYWSA